MGARGRANIRGGGKTVHVVSNYLYAPEAHIMYLTVVFWFLISFFVMGGAARAGRTSSFMHLLLHPPQYGPWNHPRGLLCIQLPMHAPMIYTALCIMFWMCAYPLLGQVEGFGPWKSRVFLGPNGTCLSAHCHFTGPKKLSNSSAQPPPTCPRNGYARIKTFCTGLFKSLLNKFLIQTTTVGWGGEE